jgi:hypothetical protein
MSYEEFIDMLMNPKNRKWFILGVIIAILIGVAALQTAEARGKHHSPPPEVTNVTEITNVYTTVTKEATGVSSALALGQCQYDYTHSLQGCVGMGFNDGTQAIAFGLAKRSDEVLISGGLALEESGNVSGAAALSFKFK